MSDGILAEIFEPIAKEMLRDEAITTLIKVIALIFIYLKVIPEFENIKDKILGR